jgi:hypothetical protein
MKFIAPSQAKLSQAIETVRLLQEQIKEETRSASCCMEFDGFVVFYARKNDGVLVKYYINPRIQIPEAVSFKRYNPDLFNLPNFLTWLETIDPNDWVIIEPS